MGRFSIKKINALMPSWNSDICYRACPTMPSQSMGEWLAYLEFIEGYFRHRRIKQPVVVEIGIGFGNQKRYYEDILGFTHIGIDILSKRNPDIQGNSHKPETMDKLIKMLDGREVNIVYIDGKHNYEAVKKDYELYAPLAKNIIIVHDVSSTVPNLAKSNRRFWGELVAEHAEEKGNGRTFITITGHFTLPHTTIPQRGQGTGLLLLEDMT